MRFNLKKLYLFFYVQEICQQYFVLCSKSSENEIRNEIKSDQVELSSTDDEIVRNSNESVNGENSKLNNIFCK